jgi:hypothetical protein
MKDPNKFNDLMDAFTGELKAIKEYGSESMYMNMIKQHRQKYGF